MSEKMPDEIYISRNDGDNHDLVVWKDIRPDDAQKYRRVDMQAFSPDKIDLTAEQAIGCAISCVSTTKTMDDCQYEAAGFIKHLENLDYKVIRADKVDGLVRALDGMLDNYSPMHFCYQFDQKEHDEQKVASDDAAKALAEWRGK